MGKVLLSMSALVAVITCFISVISPAFAAPHDITVEDTDVFPESIDATPDGTVFLGSLKKPIIYRALPNSNAKAWIDLTGNQPVTCHVRIRLRKGFGHVCMN